ncbi:MAG: aldehyde dehydrogenase family protein, partial [Albidovulum sp.]
MTIETRLFIAGRWQDGESTVENRSPSDVTDLIGDFAQASTAQLDEALAAARAAQPLWWAAGIQKRHDVLMAIGTELMARA